MQCINHVLYADDICPWHQTAIAVQCMLDICYNYGLDNDVLFNPLKSVCMLFKPKRYKLYTVVAKRIRTSQLNPLKT